MSRETFAQKSRPIDVLKDILGNYPFGVGIFRELIQNADDAGATTQVSQIIYCTKALDCYSEVHMNELDFCA